MGRAMPRLRLLLALWFDERSNTKDTLFMRMFLAVVMVSLLVAGCSNPKPKAAAPLAPSTWAA